MSPATTLPDSLPGLREEAERLAREYHTALEAGVFIASAHRTAIKTHAALLRDLTRRESRNWAARWLAGKVGLDTGVNCPRWIGPKEGGYWSIESDLLDDDGQHESVWFHGHYAYDPHVKVAGIGGVTDPTIALCMACVAVAGAK